MGLEPRDINEILDAASETGTNASTPTTPKTQKPVNRSIECFRCGMRGHIQAQCRTKAENCWATRYQPYGKGGKGKGKGKGGKGGKGAKGGQASNGGISNQPVYNIYFGCM